MATISNMSSMTRSRESWPAHRAKKRKRNRERKNIARAAQLKKDDEQSRKP